MEDVFGVLGEAARKEPRQFVTRYVDHFVTLNSLENDISRLRSKMTFKSSYFDIDRVKASVLLHDLSLIELDASNSMTLIMVEAVEQWRDDKQRMLDINVPANSPIEFLNALEKGAVRPAFVTPDDEGSLRVLQTLSPLIHQGFVLPKPARSLMYLKLDHADKSREWSLVPVVDASLREPWTVSTFTPQQVTDQAIIFSPSSNMDAQNTLFEVTIPILKNVSIEDMTRVLIDEKDLIDEFRSNFKTAIMAAVKDQKNSSEIYNDVVRPRIAKIDRKFRQLTTLGRFKAGAATVVSAAATLSAAWTSGTAAAVSSIAGAAGAAAVINQVATLRQEQEAMKDDFAYLLWKMSNPS